MNITFRSLCISGYNGSSIVGTYPVTMPISLSDSAMTCLLQLAEPLPVADRGRFLEAVAARLAAEPTEVGDGMIHRIARDEQRKLLTPPKGDHSLPSRWSRRGAFG
jgi:hypothetical protein